MTRIFAILAISLALGTTAQAACYADYKAKQNDPLRLHYGVAQIDDAVCTPDAARDQLTPRLARDGWTLLNILTVFDDTGLEERKESAGKFYLRY